MRPRIARSEALLARRQRRQHCTFHIVRTFSSNLCSLGGEAGGGLVGARSMRCMWARCGHGVGTAASGARLHRGRGCIGRVAATGHHPGSRALLIILTVDINVLWTAFKSDAPPPQHFDLKPGQLSHRPTCHLLTGGSKCVGTGEGGLRVLLLLGTMTC